MPGSSAPRGPTTTMTSASSGWDPVPHDPRRVAWGSITSRGRSPRSMISPRRARPSRRAGALTGQSSHGATKSLYGVDPDGNEFEIMWLLPRDAWGDYESKAVVEALELDAEIARWSGVETHT